MSRGQQERNISEARAIVALLNSRTEQERAGASGSHWHMVENVLRTGLTPGEGRSRYALPRDMSRRQEWTLNVSLAALSLGDTERDRRINHYTLMARLGRRAKSPEASWDTIASELERSGLSVTASELRRGFSTLVAAFLCTLDANGISRDYTPAPPFAHRCAREEQGQRCAVA